MSVTTYESHVVSAINTPGIAGELLTSLPTSWPNSWHPASLSLDSWRSLTWPFFCLPFWWFAGRGIDALLGWRGPRWWSLLIGTLLCAGFLILLVGIWCVESFQERATSTWLWCGFGLWILLFAAFPAAWLRRALARKSTSPTIPVELPIP